MAVKIGLKLKPCLAGQLGEVRHDYQFTDYYMEIEIGRKKDPPNSPGIGRFVIFVLDVGRFTTGIGSNVSQ